MNYTFIGKQFTWKNTEEAERANKKGEIKGLVKAPRHKDIINLGISCFLDPVSFKSGKHYKL